MTAKFDDSLVLDARDTFFRRLRMPVYEIFEDLRSARMLQFAAFMLVIFLILDAAALNLYMSPWRSAMVWTQAIGLQIAIYIGLGLGWAWLQARLGAPAIYLPIIGMAAYALNYPVTVLHVGLQTDRSFFEVVKVSVMFTGAALSVIFEALYYVFVYPLMHTSRRQREHERGREITVAGESFGVSDLISLKSQEHYVVVATPAATHRLRARLSDVVSQLDETDGVQAHRSHWVSRDAISTIVQKDGTDHIVTITGESLPVARPRKGEVRAWVASHRPDAMSPEPIAMSAE